MTDHEAHRPSTPGLFADALSQVALLVETEIRLVRSEVSEKITQAISAVAVLVVAAVLILTALILCLNGIVQLLIAYGWQPYAANFLVGVLIALLGAVAVMMAIKALSPANLTPSRTVTQLGKDARVAKEQVK